MRMDIQPETCSKTQSLEETLPATEIFIDEEPRPSPREARLTLASGRRYEIRVADDGADHLLVKVVPSAELTAEHRAELAAQLARRLGPGMEIEVRLVDDIPREASGKFRWVVSRVDHAARFAWDGATP